MKWFAGFRSFFALIKDYVNELRYAEGGRIPRDKASIIAIVIMFLALIYFLYLAVSL